MNTIKEWVDGIEEEDCIGFVKIKEVNKQQRINSIPRIQMYTCRN